MIVMKGFVSLTVVAMETGKSHVIRATIAKKKNA